MESNGKEGGVEASNGGDSSGPPPQLLLIATMPLFRVVFLATPSSTQMTNKQKIVECLFEATTCNDLGDVGTMTTTLVEEEIEKKK